MHYATAHTQAESTHSPQVGHHLHVESHQGLTFIQYAGLIAVFFFLFWGPALYEIKHTTLDEMNVALWNLDNAVSSAVAQGRLTNVTGYPLLKAPYLSNNTLYLFSFRLLGLALASLSVSSLFGTLARSPWVSALCFLSLTFMWSNSIDGHNLVVAYPFTILCNYSLLLFSMTLAVKGARTAAHRLVTVSAVMSFTSLITGGEYVLQLIPLVLGLPFHYCKGSYIRRIKFLSPLFAAVFAGGALIVLFRAVYPSQYDGNTALLFSASRIATTWLTLTLGLAPLRQVWRNRFSVFDDPISIYYALCVSLVAYMLVLYARKRLPALSNDSTAIWDYGSLILASVGLITLPNILLAFTRKYQDWVILHGVVDFTYSSLAYFGTIALPLFLLVTFRDRRIVYGAIALTLSVICFLTTANNLYVASVMRTQSQKWPLFEAALSQLPPQQDEGPRLSLSKSFFEHQSPVNATAYWNRYASAKCQSAVVITDNTPGDSTALDLYTSHRNGQYALLTVKGRVTSVLACGSTMPQINECGLLIAPIEQEGINLISGNVCNNVEYLPINGMPRTKVAVSTGLPVYCYTPNRYVSADNCLGVFASQLRQQNNPVHFAAGVYGPELDHRGSVFRWCFSPVQIRLTYDSLSPYEVCIRASCPMQQVLGVTIAGETTTHDLTARETTHIRRFIRPIGKQVDINIVSNKPPQSLNTADPRMFSFALDGLFVRPLRE
jgi:hypothetical protein